MSLFPAGLLHLFKLCPFVSSSAASAFYPQFSCKCFGLLIGLSSTSTATLSSATHLTTYDSGRLNTNGSTKWTMTRAQRQILNRLKFNKVKVAWIYLWRNQSRTWLTWLEQFCNSNFLKGDFNLITFHASKNKTHNITVAFKELSYTNVPKLNKLSATN